MPTPILDLVLCRIPLSTLTSHTSHALLLLTPATTTATTLLNMDEGFFARNDISV